MAANKMIIKKLKVNGLIKTYKRMNLPKIQKKQIEKCLGTI